MVESTAHANGRVHEIRPEDVLSREELRQRRSFRILSLKDLLGLPPPSWLISNVLICGSVALLFASRSAGKTFVALDFALCVATGLSFGHSPVRQGPVVYVAGEGVRGLAKRVLAWLSGKGEEIRAAAGANFHILQEAVQFGQPDEVERFLKTLEARSIRPALIVFDTLARCSVGLEENDARDMGLVMDGCEGIARATGATVLVIHHCGKDGEDERGSSAIGAAADTMLKIETGSGAEGGGNRVLICKKQRDAAEFEPIAFRLERVELGRDEDGQPEASLRVEVLPRGEPAGIVEEICGPGEAPCAEDPPRAGADPPEPDLLILRALHAIDAPDGVPAGVVIRETGISRGRVYPRLDALSERGLVWRTGEPDRYRYGLTEDGRLAVRESCPPPSEVSGGPGVRSPECSVPPEGGNGHPDKDRTEQRTDSGSVHADTDDRVGAAKANSFDADDWGSA